MFRRRRRGCTGRSRSQAQTTLAFDGRPVPPHALKTALWHYHTCTDAGEPALTPYEMEICCALPRRAQRHQPSAFALQFLGTWLCSDPCTAYLRAQQFSWALVASGAPLTLYDAMEGAFAVQTSLVAMRTWVVDRALHAAEVQYRVQSVVSSTASSTAHSGPSTVPSSESASVTSGTASGVTNTEGGSDTTYDERRPP